jgi:hypothetical protein
MKENDRSKVDKGKPEGLTVYKPEDQVFQPSNLFLFLMFGTIPVLINSRFSKITWSIYSPQ